MVHLIYIPMHFSKSHVENRGQMKRFTDFRLTYICILNSFCCQIFLMYLYVVKSIHATPSPIASLFKKQLAVRCYVLFQPSLLLLQTLQFATSFILRTYLNCSVDIRHALCAPECPFSRVPQKPRHFGEGDY